MHHNLPACVSGFHLELHRLNPMHHNCSACVPASQLELHWLNPMHHNCPSCIPSSHLKLHWLNPMHNNCPACLPGSHLELHWLNPPRKILVVAKPSPDVLRSLVRVAEWLLDPQRAMHVYVEPSVYARLGLVSELAHQAFNVYVRMCVPDWVW